MIIIIDQIRPVLIDDVESKLVVEFLGWFNGKLQSFRHAIPYHEIISVKMTAPER